MASGWCFFPTKIDLHVHQTCDDHSMIQVVLGSEWLTKHRRVTRRATSCARCEMLWTPESRSIPAYTIAGRFQAWLCVGETLFRLGCWHEGATTEINGGETCWNHSKNRPKGLGRICVMRKMLISCGYNFRSFNVFHFLLSFRVEEKSRWTDADEKQTHGGMLYFGRVKLRNISTC